MITEGMILSLDYTSNECSVRVPIFETVGTPNEIILNGRILIQPGFYNCYKINDLVWVTFVDNSLNKPLVIGKIYQSPEVESQTVGGSLNVANLKVNNNSAILPSQTQFTNTSIEYNSVDKLINHIKQLEDKIVLLQQQVKELQQQ